MKTRSRILMVSIFLTLFVTLTCLIPVNRANAKMVLSFPQTSPKGYYYDLLALKMNEIVSQKTKGEIEIKSYPGGQLGNDQELQAAIKMGTVDLYVLDMGVMGFTEGGKDFNIIFLPYLFRDQDHFYKFLKSKTFERMLKDYQAKSGIKVLGYGGDRGPRQITTTKTAVWTPEDMKGLKIRVPKVKTFLEAFSAWGANPTPMNFPELFSALQQGVVEGQDNGLDMIESTHFYEVQKYLILTEHVRSGTLLVTNPKNWEKKFNDNQRKIIVEALEEGSKYISKLVWENEAQGIRRVTHKHGMRVIIPDVLSFQEKVKDVGPKLDGELWSNGLYGEIQAIK